MGVTLPFAFDSSGVVKVILRGLAGLLAVVVAGILYSLFVSRRPAAAFALLVIAGITTYFATRFVKYLTGTTGVITADAVIVEPARLYGIPLAGPAGRFPLDRFTAVRVERLASSLETYGRGHERVSLVGKNGTPDILLARTELDSGRAMGRQLAAVLNLPFEETQAAY